MVLRSSIESAMVIQRNSREPLESPSEIDPLLPDAADRFRATKMVAQLP
jgi:hypothetical protein